MTTDEIANYCEIRDCSVYFGSAGGGFARIDGTGLTGRFNNYRRFLAHHELHAIPEVSAILDSADEFRIEAAGEAVVLARDKFEREVRRLLDLVEA